MYIMSFGLVTLLTSFFSLSLGEFFRESRISEKVVIWSRSCLGLTQDLVFSLPAGPGPAPSVENTETCCGD